MNQGSRRQQLYDLLGILPDRDRPISVTLVATEEREDYILEKLVLDLNGEELVPAYFAKPKTPQGPLPTILYNHAHGGDYDIGKEEMIEWRKPYFQYPPYADLLTRMGYNALCIDTWAFGDRRGRTESEVFKEMLWRGKVMWGMMVYDSLRAIDYLTTRPDVDASRIGTIGLSMGSTMAWWVAALDERVKVCIDICCLTDFDAIVETRGLDGHGIYYYVPSLLNHFSAADINALIAPRPHLSVAGIYDLLTPPKGMERIDRQLREAYSIFGAPDAWQLITYPQGHFENASMRAEIVKFLRKWL